MRYAKHARTSKRRSSTLIPAPAPAKPASALLPAPSAFAGESVRRACGSRAPLQEVRVAGCPAAGSIVGGGAHGRPSSRKNPLEQRTLGAAGRECVHEADVLKDFGSAVPYERV